MKNIIIFDMMGVIFTVGDDTNELLLPYIHAINSKIPAELIRYNYKDASLGHISASEFWIKSGVAQTEAEAEQIQAEYLTNSLIFDSGFIECASMLKKKYTLAILSNDISQWNSFLRRKHGIDRFIPDEFAFISSDLGLRKPAPEIYIKVLKKLNAQAQECIFIDDDPQRVDAADMLGITSVLFNRESHDFKGLQARSFAEIQKLLS